jgi:hypothetical protein
VVTVTVLVEVVAVPVLFMIVVLIDMLHGVLAVVVLVDFTPILVILVKDFILAVLVLAVVQLVIKVEDQPGEQAATHRLVTVEVAAVDQHLVYLVDLLVLLLTVDLVVLVATLVGGIRETLDGLLTVDMQT